jgi:hypothetical protein
MGWIEDAYNEEKQRAPELLEEGAETFRERNRTYGNNYHNFGAVMAGLFPEGLHVVAGDVAGFARLGVLVQVVSKIGRYANRLPYGGHVDSAHDIMVYGAMLQEVTKDES